MNLQDTKILSQRLLLIPITMEYKESIFKEFTSKITTFMYPKPAEKIEETEEFINGALEELKEGSDLQLVVLDKETKEFLGCAGLHRLDRKTPEFGIWIKESAHGNGYGKEAIIAVKEWADTNIDYEYILYPVVDDNYASKRIPEFLGGEVAREYDEVNLSGVNQHILEYRVPNPNTV